MRFSSRTVCHLRARIALCRKMTLKFCLIYRQRKLAAFALQLRDSFGAASAGFDIGTDDGISFALFDCPSRDWKLGGDAASAVAASKGHWMTVRLALNSLGTPGAEDDSPYDTRRRTPADGPISREHDR